MLGIPLNAQITFLLRNFAVFLWLNGTSLVYSACRQLAEMLVQQGYNVISYVECELLYIRVAHSM